MLFWFVLVPLTIGVWAQVLFGYPNFDDRRRTTFAHDPIRIQSVLAAPPPVRRYTVCGIAGAENCWVAEAR
ncbi:MAG: hypothetical protein WAO08_35020 [Hyphomicrobiaceae bacterium]